jgi:magnesium transporter
MIKIFKTFGGYIEIPSAEKDCWINVTQPIEKEIQRLSDEFKLPADIINDILDVDERSRIEYEDSWTLVIMRIPVESSANGVPFYTIPLGVFMSENFTLTLCLQNN